MSETTPRKALIIPTAEELIDAVAEIQARASRRHARGEYVEVNGRVRVNALDAADQIMEEYPHIADNLIERSSIVGDAVEQGLLDASEAFALGARHILELMSIATTAAEFDQIARSDSGD